MKSWLNKVLIIIPALLIPLIYSKSTVDPALLPKFAAFSIYILFFLIAILYSGVVKKNNFNPSILRSNLISFFLGYVIACGISLLSTTNLADGIFEWAKIFLFFCFLIFTVLYFHKEDNFIELLCKSISMLSVIINIIGLYQFYWLVSHQGVTHKTTYFVDGTFANRNLFAEVLLLTLPFVTFGALRFKSRWKIISYFALLCSLFLITATLTRAVWLGLFISALFTLILFFLFKIKTPKNASPLNFRKLLLPVVIIVSIAAAVFFYSRLDSEETFKKQISSISDIKYGGANERIELWKRSAKLINERPITGVGLASWKIEMLKFNVKGTKPEDGTTFYQHPHNDFIMVASETGIIGLVFYSLIFITAVYYIIIILKNSKTSEQLFYLLMFTGIISYCIISLFSFPKERIEQNTLLLFMIAPVIIQYHKLKGIKPIYTNLTSGISLFISLLFLTIISFSMFIGKERIISDTHMLQALNAKNKANWPKVASHINKAITPYYTMDPMSTPLAWYRGTANFNLGKTDEAFEDFKKAYLINPYHVHILNNLGTCYELKKDHTTAINYFSKALSINPTLEEAILNLSASYFNSGMIDSAYQTIRKSSLNTNNERYKTSVEVIVKAKFKLIKNTLEQEPFPMKLIAEQKLWLTRTHKFPELSDKEFQKLYKTCVSYKIFDFLDDTDWMIKLHAKSVKNKLSIEEQLFIDSYYLLKNIIL